MLGHTVGSGSSSQKQAGIPLANPTVENIKNGLDLL